MTTIEMHEIEDELEVTMKHQLECIELGDFETAEELEKDISYLKSKVGDQSPDFAHLI